MSSNHTNISIRAQNISKSYQLRAHQGSLREAIAHAIERRFSKNGFRKPQELWALKDISFDLMRGDALGIIGPNGAGKTTILKILSRVTRPTSGTMDVNGRLGALLELGAGFHPELTGRENIYLYGSILGLSIEEINQKFDQIVEFSGLEAFLDTPVKRYSSGMYVRLGFSVAAHNNPDVLLVDEVLAVGDAEFRQKCIERIKSLRETGVSIIFISHNLFQVRKVCERGIFLRAGEIQSMGTIDEAIRAYESWLQNSGPLSPQNSQRFSYAPGVGGDDLRIVGIEVCDQDGIAKPQFDYDEPAEIRIHYTARRPFPSLHFVLKCIRVDGVVCAVMRSSDLGIEVDELKDQGYISLHMPELQLASGTYLLEVRLRDRNDAVTLSKGSSATFNVAGPTVSSEIDGGVFIPHITETRVQQTGSGIELSRQTGVIKHDA